MQIRIAVAAKYFKTVQPYMAFVDTLYGDRLFFLSSPIRPASVLFFVFCFVTNDDLDGEQSIFTTWTSVTTTNVTPS